MGIDPSVTSVVVVGDGIAGLAAAGHVRRLQSRCAVHLVGREPHHTYNRRALADLVTGHAEIDLGVVPPEWFAEHRIAAHLGTEVVGLDVTAHWVVLDNGERLRYDRLILAMGAVPVHPPIPGLHLRGVHVLQTAEQALAIRIEGDSHPGLPTAVVLGGGPLGVETSTALTRLGMHVRLVDRAPWPLRDVVDQRVGELLVAQLATLGAHCELGVTARRVYGEQRVTAVGLSDGRKIPCDVLLVCAGKRPEVELARAAGLEVRHGVLVDETMRTSDPHVFAVGDVAEHRSGGTGLGHAATAQAKVAAEQAVARRSSEASRSPGSRVIRLDVPGLQVVSIGRNRPQPNDQAVVVLDDPRRRRYRKVVVAEDGGVAGGIVVNDPDAVAAIESATARGVDVRPLLQQLRRGDFAALEPATGRMTSNRRLAWVTAGAVLCAVIVGSAALLGGDRTADPPLVLGVGALVVIAAAVLFMARRARPRHVAGPDVMLRGLDAGPGGATVPGETSGSEAQMIPMGKVSPEERRSEAAGAESRRSPAEERPPAAVESEEAAASAVQSTDGGRTGKSQAASAAAAVAAAEQRARAVAAAARSAAEAASAPHIRHAPRPSRRPGGDAVQSDPGD